MPAGPQTVMFSYVGYADFTQLVTVAPVGTTTLDADVDYFTQLDLTTSYKLDRNWEIYGELLNVTNEPFRVHFAESAGRFLQFEEYGVSANFGVRWKL